MVSVYYLNSVQSKAMKQAFDKRIFNYGLFLKDFGFLLKNFPKLIGAFRNKEISKAFMEKIMTVVTAVNGCTYCTWFHSKQAISSGLTEEEVVNMLNLQFQADASEEEMAALLYAQNFAETNRNPDPELTEKLFETYGDRTAKHIQLLIRVIFFANLQGNTFDAFLSRLKGLKAKQSNVIFEFFFFIFNIPILCPMYPFTKRYR